LNRKWLDQFAWLERWGGMFPRSRVVLESRQKNTNVCKFWSRMGEVAKKMGKLEEAYLKIFKSSLLDLGPTMEVRLRRHEIW
jgi:hypothetical protein